VSSYDIAIVGAGPSGLYAAYYAGFRGFSTVVVDTLSEPGGQISAMYPEKDIFDVAGFPRIKGKDLIDGLLEQANQFSPTYRLGEQAQVLSVSDTDGITLGLASGESLYVKALIITGGIGSFTPRELPVGQEWIGRGIVYFVPSLEAHRDKDVVIVGGGDSAFDWATSLYGIAKSITIVHRRDTFRAHAATVDQVRKLDVELIINAEVAEVSGNDRVESVTVVDKQSQEQRVLPAQTVVAALGFIANIGPLAEWGLELEKRRICVDTAMRTNLPRVYAAGDISVYEGKVPLISVGFGEAATAVNNATPWIDIHQGVFPGHSSGGAE
jgi:ferredoxin/flavodoxin---NADP+ reductase